MRHMTARISRILVTTVVATIAAASLGACDLSQAQEFLNAAQVLSDFAQRLENGAKLTYTAKYQVTGGETVTLVQQPPNSAFIGKDGSYIFTKDFVYLCSNDNGTMTCQKSPNDSANVDASDSSFITGVAGPGFITPQVALGLVLVASLVPGAKVTQSTKTIAGQPSRCATVSGLDASASPGDTEAPKDFSVCITDSGVLASFSGTSTGDETASIELSEYSTTVDPKAFEPPAGAKIVDVSQIEQPS